MNFKETALLLGLSMTVPATSIAQDKVEASVGADLVSGYIWRGQDLGGVSKHTAVIVRCLQRIFARRMGIRRH